MRSPTLFRSDRWLCWLTSLLAWGALTACRAPGEVPPEGPSPVKVYDATAPRVVCPQTSTAMQQETFARRCASAECHDRDNPALTLDLVSPGLEQRLINAPSLGCRGEKLVVPGQPEQSELFRKVAHAQPECGLRMPVATPAYSEEEIACLAQWIESLGPVAPGTTDGGVAGDAAPADSQPDMIVDPGISCPTGQNVCNGACLDLATNNNNCGACGRICGAGTTCTAGNCACAAGQSLCGTSCVDTATSSTNCGGCGRLCPAGSTCNAGSCTCPTGQALCGSACVDTSTSVASCGACGRACTAGQVCAAGSCVCTTGLTSCSGSCVDVSSDANHCGRCGAPCTKGTVCAGGTCVRGGCPGGTTSCSGACVDTNTSALHCGGCNHACPSGQSCVGGTCGCGSGTTSCGGTCTSTSSDPLNCGACGRVCGAGQACSNGSCGCSAGSTLCGGVCTSTASDALNCGGCGKTCPAGSACSNASCGCSTGMTSCGSGCVNTSTDSANCGSCGHACAVGTSCSNGTCVSSCASGTTLCGGSCVNTGTDPRNCGSCGKVCAAGELCLGGTCQGCGPTVSFANQVQPIFNAGCTNNCHSGNRPAGNLSLAAGAAYAELVNVVSTCGGKKQVAPGSPSTSYLINKVTGVGMCSGGIMPKMGGELSSAQIELLRAWICQGAPNN